jgi:hypothetical protein
VIGQYFAWQAERGEAPRGTVQNSLLDLVVTLRALHSQCDGLTLQATWVPAMRRFTEAMITDLDPRAVADNRRGPALGALLWRSAGGGARLDRFLRGRGPAPRCRAHAPRGSARPASAHAGDDVPEIVAQEILVAELRSGAGRAARPADAYSGFPDSVALTYLRARLRPAPTGLPGATTPSAP